MRRNCFYILETQDPEETDGYTPVMVLEGVHGYMPITSWVWGQTLEEAREKCADANERLLDLDPKEVDKIIASSMTADSNTAITLQTFQEAP